MAIKSNCSVCLQKCDRALINGVLYKTKICNCGRLYCGACALNNTKCFCKCETRKEYPLLSKLCSFAKNAPEDELQLIDLQYTYSENCSNCGRKEDRRNLLYRHKIQQVLCAFCFEPSLTDFMWHTFDVKDSLFVGFITSLYPNGRPPVSHVQRPENNLPVKIRDLYCARCHDDIGSNANISCRPFIHGDNPYCYGSGTSICVAFSGSDRCLCLCKFIECIECIPENQLHLLTYSKWVKAVGCVRHENILNELSAVSSDGLRKGKLRSFFKDGDIANEKLVNIRSKPLNVPEPMMNSTVTTSTSESDIKKLSSKLSTVDTATPLAPKRILCQCGREEDISNVFVCNTCSVYGVCALCTIRTHSGHEYQDAVKTMVTINCVNTQSELTLHKLAKWSLEAKELNQESEKAFEKLCTTLGTSFVEVITCDDHQRIQSVLEKTDTSTLEKHFKDTVNNTRKLHKAIDYFCEDLTEAVEKDKGNIDTTSVQETSDVDRK